MFFWSSISASSLRRDVLVMALALLHSEISSLLQPASANATGEQAAEVMSARTSDAIDQCNSSTPGGQSTPPIIAFMP
jgi:hypothetical protein